MTGSFRRRLVPGVSDYLALLERWTYEGTTVRQHVPSPGFEFYRGAAAIQRGVSIRGDYGRSLLSPRVR